MTLLQREALEAKAVGGASTVKVEAVVCTTLTARSEPYSRKAIHASRRGEGANALLGAIDNLQWALSALTQIYSF